LEIFLPTPLAAIPKFVFNRKWQRYAIAGIALLDTLHSEQTLIKTTQSH